MKIWKTAFSLATASLLLAACGGGGDQTTQNSTATAPQKQEPAANQQIAGDPEKGEEYYKQYCSTCHGMDAKGVEGLGKNLVQSEFIAASSDEELIQFILDGRAADDPQNTTGIPMPPKGGNPALSEEQIVHIVEYFRELNKAS